MAPRPPLTGAFVGTLSAAGLTSASCLCAATYPSTLTLTQSGSSVSGTATLGPFAPQGDTRNCFAPHASSLTNGQLSGRTLTFSTRETPPYPADWTSALSGSTLTGTEGVPSLCTAGNAFLCGQQGT